MWQTYTPDSGCSCSRRTDRRAGSRRCLSAAGRGRRPPRRRSAAVLGVEQPSGDEELEAWIAAHVAALATGAPAS